MTLRICCSSAEFALALREGRVGIERGAARWCRGGRGPFRVLAERNGEWTEVWPEEMDWEPSVSSWRGRSAEYGVGVSLSSRQSDGGVIELSAEVSASGDWGVTAFAWPHISGLSHPGGGGSVTWPFGVGASAAVADLPAWPGLILTYPVYASMQWIDLYDERSGLYLGAHDDAPFMKWLYVWNASDGVGVRFDWTDLAVKPGETLALPPVALSVHQGDWHAGADIYRGFMQPRLDRWPAPDWFRRNPSHNTIVMKQHDADHPLLSFSDLPDLYRKASSCGIGMVHLAGYMEHGHDTDYPEYEPGDCMGGREGLARAICDIHRAGGRLSLYTNGRILDPRGPFSEHMAEGAVRVPPGHPARAAVVDMWDHLVPREKNAWDPRGCMEGGPSPWNADGSAVEENWGRLLAVMCPGAAGWRGLLLSRLARLAEGVRPDGFQVDQVAGCWCWPCYSTGHDHDRPATAWSHYRQFARDMRQRMKADDPDRSTWTEGVCDLLGEAFDCQQANLGFTTCLGGSAKWMPELYRYTFPDQHLFFGDLRGDEVEQLMHAILVSGAIHANVQDWEACLPGYREAIAVYLRWRREETDLLAGSIVAGAACSAGVACTQFASDRKLGLVALRLDGSPPGSIEVDMDRCGRTPSRALLHTAAGAAPVEFATLGDRLRLRVEADGPFLLVLS